MDRVAGSNIIFLYGPPASGKSTIGELLADNLALPFVDLDQRIEVETNLTIPEIFAKEGEEGFRRLEKALLKETLDLEWGVVALGGGTLLDPESRSQVEQAGAACHEGYRSCFFRSASEDSEGFKLTEPQLKTSEEIYGKK